jgi:alginate O-acetyltransferase complex protein AlgI
LNKDTSDLLFNSYVFLFAFLPVALAGFNLAGRVGRQAAGGWLILCSFVFYGWWNPAFCILLSISIAFNYAVSTLIVRAVDRPRQRDWMLGLGVSVNLMALIYYKYLGWLLGLLHVTFDLRFNVPSIVLPLGISFFTFTQIGYLVDCAAGVARDRDPLNYLLFVTFFPHLIAGPILHNQEIMPQFAKPGTYRWSSMNFAIGSGIFIIGLLKKGLLADPAGSGVAEAFAHPEELQVFAAWQAALSYSLQLYFDFSGYSDMAIGLARMFNVTFPLNFDSPYKARSVIDYWQRWHMTLTRYLTQYVYTPLALSLMRRRRSKGLPINRAAQQTVGGFWGMIALPIVVTMTLAGIWHGSGMQFLVFGLLHAGYLCINHAWRVAFGAPDAMPPRAVVRIGQVTLTYLCVLAASVFFRAPSVGTAVSMLGGMIGLHGLGPTLPVPEAFLSHGVVAVLAALGVVTPASLSSIAATAGILAWFLCLYGIVWIMPNTQQIFAAYAPALEQVQPTRFVRLRFRVSVSWAIALGCAMTVAVLSLGGSSEFLYFQF